MRRPWQYLVLVGVGVGLVGALLVAATTGAETNRLRVRKGAIGDGQNAAALDVRDQSGGAGNWEKYVEFEPAKRRHHSVIAVTPSGIGNDTMTVEVNYRGPKADENRWTLSAYDRRARRWRPVFSNTDVANWRWTTVTTVIDDASRFVQRNGRVRLRYVSSNANDVSQLDSIRLTLSASEPDPSIPGLTPNPPLPEPGSVALPPVNARFDYQIGGDYPLPDGVSVVSRDWFEAAPAAGAYSVCYVNAFQTQPDGEPVDRPDETSNWPDGLVLTNLADDPNWTGEYLIDLSTAAKRTEAAGWVAQMVDVCATKGYDAVEFDNLDSWGRFDEIPSLATKVPFGQSETVAYATLITEHSHSLGLAVGQKNTLELIESGQHEDIGFDFAIAEECGQFNECGSYVAGYGDAVLVIEYRKAGFRRVCRQFGDTLSIVQRDVLVKTPTQNGYVFDAC